MLSLGQCWLGILKWQLRKIRDIYYVAGYFSNVLCIEHYIMLSSHFFLSQIWFTSCDIQSRHNVKCTQLIDTEIQIYSSCQILKTFNI